MKKEKMLVTKALNELKLLDARIYNEIRSADFISAAKTVEKKVNPHCTKEEFELKAKSSFQSITDLIARRGKIKAAVVDSNAKTKLTINGEEMSVAEAIELKTSIDYEVSLLNTLKSQRNSAQNAAVKNNLALEDRIDKYIESMLGKEAKGKKDDYSEMIEPIRAANEFSLVDPINVDKKIEELENRISGFKSEVDSALQISNCVTWIEF